MSSGAFIRIPAPTVGRVVLFGIFRDPRPALVVDVDPRIPDLIQLGIISASARVLVAELVHLGIVRSEQSEVEKALVELRWARYGMGRANCWWWPPRSELLIDVEVKP